MGFYQSQLEISYLVTKSSYWTWSNDRIPAWDPGAATAAMDITPEILFGLPQIP